jgi:hypothetical protein
VRYIRRLMLYYLNKSTTTTRLIQKRLHVYNFLLVPLFFGCTLSPPARYHFLMCNVHHAYLCFRFAAVVDLLSFDRISVR